MISLISSSITKFLLKKSVIQDEEKELYDYGLFMLISYVAFFMLSVLFGLILNILFLSLLFFFIFCLVRNFAGGIHANTEIKCDIATSISLLISELLIKLLLYYNLIEIAFIMLILSAITLIFVKPITSSNKEITLQEKRIFYKKVIVITIFSVFISLICLLFNFYGIVMSISVGLSLASVLLILGTIQQKIKLLKNTERSKKNESS